MLAHERVVEHDGVAPQEVLDLHLLDKRGDVLIAVLILLKLGHLVHGQQGDIVLDEEIGKSAAHQVVALGVKDKGIDVVAGEQVAHRRGVETVDLEAVDLGILGTRLDTQQSDGKVLAADFTLEGVGQEDRVE